MKLESSVAVPTGQATVFHPPQSVRSLPLSGRVPLSWERGDTLDLGAHEDDAAPSLAHVAVLARSAQPRTRPIAFVGKAIDARRADVVRARTCQGVTAGAFDPRLLTAGSWDAVRVRPVPTRHPVVAEAQRHLGLPYRWGGRDLNAGVDCSGFAYLVYRRCGRRVPLDWFRDSSVDARVRPDLLERHGMRLVRVPRAGDVVVFGRLHVGIYVGQLQGRALYIGANHGGRHRVGRVDIMPVHGYGVRPTYFRYIPPGSVPVHGDRASDGVSTVPQ